MTVIIFSLFILVTVYVFLASWLYFFQHKLLFKPLFSQMPMPLNIPAEDVNFYTSDGIKLYGRYLTSSKNEKTILYFNGNSSNCSAEVSMLFLAQELGFNILLFDYRGFGGSEGGIKNEDDLYNDSEAAWKYLINQCNLKEEDIIIWGRSLGGAVAINLAQNKNIFAVIIESAFTSIDKVVQQIIKIFPAKILLKFKFDNINKISHIKSKVMLVHSINDEFIDFSHSQKLLAKVLSKEKILIKIHGLHEDNPRHSEQYIDCIKRFLICDA